MNKLDVVNDVLRTVDGARFATGSYIKFYNEKYVFLDVNDDQPVTPERVEQIIGHCSVCALGGLFMSHIRLYNEATGRDIAGMTPANIMNRLSTVFVPEELILIECAFECKTRPLTFDYVEVHSRQREIAADFGSRYPDPKDRVVAILNNILENGTFNP